MPKKDLDENNRRRRFKRKRFLRRQGGGGGGSSAAIGAELVINGNFSSAAGWTLQNGAVIAGGVLTCDGLDPSTTASRPAAQTLVAGTYDWSFSVSGSNNIEDIALLIGDAFVNVNSANGSKSGNLASSAVTQLILINCRTTACTIDNLSVKRAT